MKTHTKKFKIYLLILTMFLFAASASISGCGGGSYSGSGSSISIGGKVIDGAVDNATITVYDVTSNGLVEAGSGSTASDGSFSISISNYNSSDYYVLYVSGGTFNNNGTATTAPTMVGFLVPGGSPTVYISPLTTLIGELLFNSNGTLDTSLNSVQVNSILKQMLSVLSQIFNGMSGNTLGGISSSDPTQSPLFQELLTLLQDLANQIKSQTGENYGQAMGDLLSYLSNPNNEGGQQLEAALEQGGNYYFMNFNYTGNGGGFENISGTLSNGDQTGLGALETNPPPPAGLNNIAAAFSVPTNFSIWVLNAPSTADGAGTVTKLDSTGNQVGTYNAGPNPQSIAIDSGGNVWVAGSGVVTELSSAGTTENTCYLDTGGVTGNNVSYNDTNYIAVDSSNDVWVTSALGTNYTQTYAIQAGYSSPGGPGHYWENGRILNGGDQGHGAVFELNYDTSHPCDIGQNLDVEQITSGSSNGSLWNPDGISIGANGNIWVIGSKLILTSATANGVTYDNVWGTYYPDALLTELSLGGAIIMPPTPSSASYDPLGGMSADPSGNVWVEGVFNYAYQTNSYSSSYLFKNGIFSSQSFSLQPCTSSVSSVVIDASGNVWTACGSDSDVYEYSQSGSQLKEFNMASTVAGFTGLSYQHQGQMAFDPAGNAWIIGQGDNNAYGVMVINPASGSQAFYKTSATPPVAIAIETYPVPTVQSVVPANSTINVGVSATVSATFSEAMDPSTINTNTFTLTDDSDGASVPGSVSYNALTYTATFTPSSNLSSGVTYMADITTGAKSSQGTAIASTYSWNFTTAFASSGGSKTFTVGTGPAGIAIDASGNIWVANEGSGGSVTELNSSGGLVNTFSGVNISDPAGIAIDASGNVWLANMATTYATELLKSSNYSTSQTFDIGIPELNSIAIDASGNVWVTDAYSGASNVFELLNPAYTSNNAFAVGSGGGKPVGIAIDKSGNVWVAYNSYGYGEAIELLGPNYASNNMYGANLKDPAGLAIDSGANVWVTNNGSSDNTVVEFPYSSYSSSIPYIVGTSPTGVAIDANQNVWVANYGDGTVSELSSGAVIHTYSVGTKPTGIAIDASGNVWVANYGDGTVTELIGAAKGPEFFPYSGPQFP